MANGRACHSSEPPLIPIASVRVLKRIPRACRDQAGLKPATVLEGVVSKNDVPAWERVLYFGTQCLRGFQLGVVAGCISLPREISSCMRRRRTLLLSHVPRGGVRAKGEIQWSV